jgi:Lrp/AsnC family transcriptional regulator, regulator for asnA, asnC and gidA
MGQAMLGGEINSTKDGDSLDCRILNLLQEDCRLSFSKIAAKTNVAVGTAYNRIKNLEARGFVKGYTALVDSAKLVCGLTVVIFVQTGGGYLTMVEKKIAECCNVVAIYEFTGEFDAAVIAKFKDRGSLNTFIKDLAAMPNVKRTITNVSLNSVKEDFRIKLP